MQKVEVQKVIEAPVQAVWEQYTDHRSWTDWGRIGTVTLDREGTPAPNGVGCVRKIKNGPMSIYEEILSFDPPRRMTYRIVKGGGPLKDHAGEVVFEPHERGTRVTWRCQFSSRVPGLGGLLQRGITRMFTTMLQRLSEQKLG